MLRIVFHGMIAAVLLLILAGQTLAQGRGGGGGGGTSSFGSGGFGSSGFGSSGFGSSGFGSGGFGSSGFGSSGFGSGGFGSSGFGSSGFGSGGFGSSGFGSGGFGSGGFGASPFTGGFGQGGQNFVGRDSSDMQALFNNLGRSSNQFFNQLGRTLNGGSRRNRPQNQNQDQAQNNAPPVRVQFRLAPEDRAVPVVTASQIQTRLQRVFADAKFASPDITVEGDVVTLRGTAPSENRRLVIEKLAELEPGVGQVWNLMTVAPTADEPTRQE
jgi:BON domain